MLALVRFTAQYFFAVVLLLEGAYVLAFHRDRLKELVLAALAIGIVSYLVSLIANRLVPDPRPFVVGGFKPLIHGSTDNGFPSDHTLLLAASAAVTMLASRRAGLLGLLAAVFVGLARVYAGVHHLADIAGSLVIVALVYILYLALRRGFGRHSTTRGPRRDGGSVS